MILKRLLSNRSMVWFSVLMLSLLICSVLAQAQSKAPVRVLIFPFEVNAPEDLSYISPQIASLLADNLEKQGARIVELKDEDRDEALRAAGNQHRIAALASRYETDQVVWGGFTMIGNRYSLDARLIQAPGAGAAPIFSVEGQSLETLPSAIQDLAVKIGMSMFQRETVAEIRVEGNQRIESDAILRNLQTRTGDVYQPDNLSKDLRAVYGMGYFDDVRVEADDSPAGKIVTFHVKEKPTIRRIRIKGHTRFKDEEIKENLTLSTGAILNIYKIRSNLEQIESLYKSKNYHEVRVDYEIQPLDNNQADLEFIIDEGPKLYVTTITFQGNEAFDRDDLLGEIKTSEKGFFYWLTSSGDLDRATLDQDIARLNAFYHNQGFIYARVGDPEVEILEDHIAITVKINEGPRFKIGEIDISGDLIMPKEELLPKLTIKEGDYYNQEKVRNDIITLSDIYGNHGYADVDVRQQIGENPEKQTVKINFAVNKGEQITIDDIIISGNTRTRDKVIRREMRIQEQELFNASKIKRSIRNLVRLDYFEDIKVNQIPSPEKNKMSLKLDVKEKSTGQLSFGAGYSGEEDFFFVASIAQRNFLGRGQTLSFNGRIGGRTTDFILEFTEPWLMDTRLSGTIKAYNTKKEYETYDRDTMGGGLSFSYPVYDYTRLYWGYTIEQNEVDEIEADASQTVFDMEGKLVNSSAMAALGYDSRNHPLNPSEGSKHRLSVEYAGLGGDIGYAKYMAETGWYFPIYKGLVGFVHGKAGFVHEVSDDKLLPDYEKFYLGGINSLRGFGWRGVHLTEKVGDTETEVGGESMVQFNLELIFPLVEKMGVMGVVFYDTGNVYEGGIELGNLRSSIGGGIRWFSPLAPIRLEYGHILDREGDESSGRWEFTMGGAF